MESCGFIKRYKLDFFLAGCSEFMEFPGETNLIFQLVVCTLFFCLSKNKQKNKQTDILCSFCIIKVGKARLVVSP